MPTRVKLSRRVRLPAGARSVAAPTKFQNPYRPRRRSPEANADAVEAYRAHLRERPDLVAAARTELAGYDLACWCEPGLPCHADVLLAVVRGEEP